jgi:hypothetical protein
MWRPLERIAFAGVAPDDSDYVRVQKVTLTVAAIMVTVLSVFWVVAYWVLGLPARLPLLLCRRDRTVARPHTARLVQDSDPRASPML